jgi:small-conductance mechanosensitive channel
MHLLCEIKSLKKSEESFKAELQAKASQIDALRSGALSGLISRQAALYERRLNAVEQLWGTVVSLAPAKHISSMMAVLKWDVASEKAEKDLQVREMFKSMGSGFDFSKLQTTDASKARPFVSSLV